MSETTTPRRGPTCLRAMGLRCWAPPTCGGFTCERRALPEGASQPPKR